MSKGSAPSAPDPYTTAQAQYQYGTEAADYTAALNRVNTTGPTGSTTYAITGYDPTTGAPIYSQNTTLSPQEQTILGQSEGLQSGQLSSAQNSLAQYNALSGQGEPNILPVQYGVNPSPISELNTSGVQPVQGSINTAGVPGIANVQSLEQYGQNTALAGEEAAIMPGMQQQEEQLKAQLINSGAHPGDPAYDNAMAAFDANMNNAQTQAAGAAITAGTGLQSTNYGESANTNQQLFGEAATQQLQSNTAQQQELAQAEAEQQAANQAQQQQFTEGTTNAQLNNSAGSTALADWAQQLGIPLSDLNQILGNSSVQTPTANAPGTSSVSAPDIMSAFQNQYNSELAQYNANVSSQNALLGDATTLGGLALLGAAS